MVQFKKVITLLLVCFLSTQLAHSQKLWSGPMQGHTETTSTEVWFQTKDATNISITLKKLTNPIDSIVQRVPAIPGLEFNGVKTHKVTLDNLTAGTTYSMSIKSDNLTIGQTEILSSKPESSSTDFDFLIGSCAFIGTGKDKFYKLWNSTRIFNTLTKEEKGDFMLWMGDHVYLMGKEFKSTEGAYERYSKVRKHKKLDGFLKTRHHYSTWDDHDFGPNNCDGNFDHKDKTRPVFEAFWQNPTPAIPANGIFYKVTKNDVDIFMLDDRFNRNDSDQGEKCYFGEVQLNWLKEELKKSTATFKILVSGNQVLNHYEDHESFMHYPKEKKELFDFIRNSKVEGVVFFSGDRHHSEVLKIKEEGLYPFYDFTCSGLTSWRYPWRKISAEKNNPIRVGKLMNVHNYGIVSISGADGNRSLELIYKNKFGKEIQRFKVEEKTLKFND